MTKRILVISGHPDLETSQANSRILEQLKAFDPGIQIRELSKLYGDYKIDIKEEQKQLLAHDVIVLQFPFYWYSFPAILKKWIDDVFTYGFAYGSTGDKLTGKKLLLSFTIGGSREYYQENFTIEELEKPFKLTAKLTGLIYLEPIRSFGMGIDNTPEEFKTKSEAHAVKLIETLKKLDK